MKPLTHGTPVHFDIAGPDAGELAGFYSRLFDWGIDRKGPGYSLIETPDSGPNGAIVEMETSSFAMGVAVKSVDDALSKTESLGGTVVMPTTDNGWVKKAQIADPSGNVLTLIEI